MLTLSSLDILKACMGMRDPNVETNSENGTNLSDFVGSGFDVSDSRSL
jgi:hypothetical protein